MSFAKKMLFPESTRFVRRSDGAARREEIY
jgi:hypothetical protein